MRDMDEPALSAPACCPDPRPDDEAALRALPGIGPATAAGILAFANPLTYTGSTTIAAGTLTDVYGNPMAAFSGSFDPDAGVLAYKLGGQLFGQGFDIQ